MGFIGAYLRRPGLGSKACEALKQGLGGSSSVLQRTVGGSVVVVATRPDCEIVKGTDGSFAVIDGELFSHRDGGSTNLKKVLAEMAHRGPEALAGIDAAFGLSIVDLHSSTVLAARDPVGNGSMFFAETGWGVVWGSRLRDLRAALGTTTPDWRGVDFFLSNGFVPSPWTMYEDIARLGPGECVLMREERSGQSLEIQRYHDFSARVPDLAEEDRLGILRRRLPEAVRARVHDIDRTGVLLSGGVDSQMVAALVARDFGPPRAFTFEYLDYEGPINEGSQARACAEFIGAEHVLIPVKGEALVDRLPALGESAGEPVARTIHTVLLDEVLASGVETILTGDGADSLYLNGGDRKALAMSMAPALIQRLARAIPDRISPNDPSAWPLPLPVRRFVDGFRRSAQRAAWEMNVSLESEFLSFSARSRIYRDRDRASRGQEALLALVADEADRLRELGTANRLRSLEFRFDSADDLLRRNLDIAQVNGVRIRSPIFSLSLMSEWIEQSVPTRASIRQTSREFTKADLRRYASTLLPSSLANAPKKGHSIPVHLWLRGPLQPWISEMTSPDQLRRHGLFDSHEVGRLVKAHMAGAPFGWALWVIAGTTLWLDEISQTRPAWLRFD